MKADEIMAREDFQKCVEFHGHVCPGLSMGYRASKAALNWLQENRSEDEEVIVIVETDACCVDAIQVLTGCTFGKGNFVYRDYGKMAFTFFSRSSGKGIRLVLKDDGHSLSDEFFTLFKKKQNNTATDEELNRFNKMFRQKNIKILEKPLDEIFAMETITSVMPDKARVEPSKPCERCGEPVMRSKLQHVDGQQICAGCLA